MKPVRRYAKAGPGISGLRFPARFAAPLDQRERHAGRLVACPSRNSGGAGPVCEAAALYPKDRS